MKTARLGDLTEPVKTWNPTVQPNGEFVYIDLSAVDNVSKMITGATPVLGSEAPSRARQLVVTGDILVSTVRPNLNAVAVVTPDLDGATASTGFAILRPTANLYGRYLFHWVRSPVFVRDMVSKATGASYPAVSDRIVKNSELPAPPLPEQRRIAAILDHADCLRAKRRLVIQQLDALSQSIFTWVAAHSDHRGSLKDLGVDFVSGKNVLGDELASHPNNRVIKVSAISSGVFRPAESKPMPADYTPPDQHKVRKGDILFGRASGSLDLLGATAEVDVDVDDLYLPDKVWRVLVKQNAQVNLQYVLGLLRSSEVLGFVRHNASGAAGVRNISKATLLECQVPLPPWNQQVALAESYAAINRQRARARLNLQALDVLFDSLQFRAFRGDL